MRFPCFRSICWCLRRIPSGTRIQVFHGRPDPDEALGLHAERQEEDPVGYISQLDNLDIEFPPYEDPPPPYSPPKPPEIPQGEAPPPYVEREDGELTGTISSRQQLIPYGNDTGQTTVSNGNTQKWGN